MVSSLDPVRSALSLAKVALEKDFDGWLVNNTAGTGITAAKQEFPALTFTFTEGLVLTAKFIPNPFTAALVGSLSSSA